MIGQRKKIVSSDTGRMRFEGYATVIGPSPSGRPNRALVRFDDGRVEERFIDPVAQLIDIDLYVDEINRALAEMTVVAGKSLYRKTAVDDRGHGSGGAPLA